MGNKDVDVDKKHWKLMHWPDGFPMELKFSLKLAFWVWFGITAALVALLWVFGAPAGACYDCYLP